MTLAIAEPGSDAAGGVLDTVRLPGGRTLTVRTVTKADVEGLDALFGGLSEEDRYYRFFSMSRPPRRFVEQLARAADEGGYRLVAVVSGPRDELVAEAGYCLLPDGNGEFALTVADGWRGWLGPFLLDAVAATAAARDVPNLQADILQSNVRMLALVARRGYAVLHREGSELRVAIDAAQPRPRPRSRLPRGAVIARTESVWSYSG
jgi:acetate---CoA ligase (ADP-forming)